jgi:hypothetical protein
MPQISGEMTVCAGNSKSYTTPLVEGHSYLWEVTGATVTAGQTTNEATISWETAGAYTLKITETNDATQCSRVLEGTVTVNMLPVIPSRPTGSGEVDLYLVGTTEYSTTGPQSLNYTWEVLPSEAGTISGNNTTATVTWNGNYRGNATVSVKTSNECGESPWSEAITTRVFSSLGIGDPESVSGIHISPNPNHGEFHLTIALPSLTSITYRILDSKGSIVHEKKDIPFKGAWQETLNLDLSAGTYSIVVVSASGNVARKFVVK